VSSKTLAMKLFAVLGSATLVFLVGCGGNTSQPPAPTAVTVYTVQRDGSDRWRAAIHCDGESQRRQPGRHLELLRNRLQGASCGTIDATGKYTAPNDRAQSATVTVRATSVADSARAAVAAVNVMTAVK